MNEREEATDELTHRLGGSRVQLGMNMKATCLPTTSAASPSATPEEGVCYFGIIDILQVRLMQLPHVPFILRIARSSRVHCWPSGG